MDSEAANPTVNTTCDKRFIKPWGHLCDENCFKRPSPSSSTLEALPDFLILQTLLRRKKADARLGRAVYLHPLTWFLVCCCRWHAEGVDMTASPRLPRAIRTLDSRSERCVRSQWWWQRGWIAIQITITESVLLVLAMGDKTSCLEYRVANLSRPGGSGERQCPKQSWVVNI